MDIDKAAAAEKCRIEKLLSDIDPARLKILAPTIENVAWMKAKLDSTREVIQDAQVTIAYDNGGGQRGVRKNPAFEGYHQLWKSYQAGLKILLEALPAEDRAEKKDTYTGPPTVLELVKSKKAI